MYVCIVCCALWVTPCNVWMYVKCVCYVLYCMYVYVLMLGRYVWYARALSMYAIYVSYARVCVTYVCMLRYLLYVCSVYYVCMLCMGVRVWVVCLCDVCNVSYGLCVCYVCNVGYVRMLCVYVVLFVICYLCMMCIVRVCM